MKATVDRLTVKDAIKHVNAATGRHISLPALSGVHLEADADSGTVTLTRTDLSRTVTATVDAEVATSGVAIIPAKAFAGLVKTGDDTVTLVANDEQTLTLNGGAEVDVRQMRLEDWPTPPTFDPNDSVTWDVDQQATVATVAKFASTEEARPILTAIQLLEGEVAATDSYRLGIGEVTTPGDVLFRADTFQTVHKWKTPTLSVSLDTTNGIDSVYFTGTATAGPKGAPRHVRLTLSDRTVEGKFPNVRGLLPDQHDGELGLPVKATVDAIAALETFWGKQKNAPVVFGTDEDLLTLTVKNHQVGEGTSKVKAAADFDPTDFAYNPALLRDSILAAAGDGDTVTMRVRDRLNPAVFVGDGVEVLLMPMRVN